MITAAIIPNTLAQTAQYTFQFGQFHESTNFENPGFMNPESRFTAVATNFNYTGVFSEIRAYMVHSQARVMTPKQGHRVTAGVNFMNEQEGPPINRGRYHGHISYLIPFRDNLSLAAGIALGWASFNIKGTSAKANGNDQRPDGNIGLWLRAKHLDFGIAVDQLFGQQLNPINESFVLSRYPIVHSAYHSNLSSSLLLRCYGRFRYLKQDNYNVDLSVNTRYRDVLVTGVSYRSINALFFYAGMEQVALGKWELQLNVGYQYTLIKTTTTRANAFEILAKVNLPSQLPPE